MSEIDPYVRVLLFREVGQLVTSSGAYRREEISSSIQESILDLLNRFDVSEITDVAAFAEATIDELCSSNVISIEHEKFAGTYYRYYQNNYHAYRFKAIDGNEISAAAERIGSRFFPDVFSGFIKERDVGKETFPSLGLAPASNRIVSFSDNQVSELDRQTSELIDVVSEQNQIDGNPGLRELLLGQLRAGRELLRAGSFRVYLLEVTLIQSLRFLAERYEREVIGGLAGALISALLKHIGVNS